MESAERHAWKLFLGLGLLFIAFGVSDVSIAVTFVSRQLALTLIVIGALQSVISLTALREGQRWAWLLMWIWPTYAVADGLVLLKEPTRGVAYAAFSASLALITAIALLLCHRRYLRPS